MKTSAQRDVFGFTLIEMMVVVSIVAILAVIAIPSYITTIKQDRIVTTANSMLSVFKLARSEAIKRESALTLNATQDGKWQAMLNNELIVEFDKGLPGVSVNGMVTQTLAATGETNAANITISDGDNATEDRCVKIYISGQSQIIKGACHV